jgi:hypothetical protein
MGNSIDAVFCLQTAFDAVSNGEAFVPVTGLSGSGTIRDALLLNLRHYGVPVTNMSAAVVCAEACRVASSAGKVDWRAFAPLAAVSLFSFSYWQLV